ncbi:HD family phosphohydrolase [Spongiivirga citrea]|uniref:HDIG domain-containing protein n=1 Tax=Spongiivirga citrea TaxID=1481457 RepID=A0A6M0CD35_9FLAO|nr:HDIG domain-containing metalloprotein [Spongiivirga citrea]NER15748.1 HDIG domain-containing protein [Spongiivirga citrea]
MNKFSGRIYQNQSLIYKIFLYVLTTVLIVYFFPKGGKFKYEFQKGKPWQYENLYAEYDFAIQKTEAEIEIDQERIKQNITPYYRFDGEVVNQVSKKLDDSYRSVLIDSIIDGVPRIEVKRFADNMLKGFYQIGIISNDETQEKKTGYLVKNGNQLEEITIDKLIKISQLRQRVRDKTKGTRYRNLSDKVYNLLFEVVKPNVLFDKERTDLVTENALKNISYTKGNVEKGIRIISKGEVVEGQTFRILDSLKSEYESQVWSESNYYWIVVGYTLLVALALLMLFLFLKKYRFDIYEDNTKVTFLFFNMILMVLLTTFVVKVKADYVYIVPLCILPITIKAFFDARLGLFTHVITVLILGFIVPDSFEYLFLQIIAGIVTILTVSELSRRANLFISLGQIVFVYALAYFAFVIIQEGTITALNWTNIGFFALNGLLCFLVLFLILIYEKAFGLVSDVSLLELSDTNSKLLKELANVAPGTFHHSLQVANLAEAAANEIGANAMLVRVGALYHDIGKMHDPVYFSENQATSINPHDELAPDESARIIFDHVLEGIKIAKKNNLPDRIIDFIRTHHGTLPVYYFFMKQQEINPETNIDDFRYPGPMPFSRETAILMMSDSVEAASKSLKEPTASKIDNFVERIIDKQMEEGQFLNADITFKEIQIIKKVLKRKLNNIYHLRVEYPE